MSITDISTSQNVVLILSTNHNDKYILKASKLPTLTYAWEKIISDTLKSNINGLKHFGRVINSFTIPLGIDSSGNSMPVLTSKIPVFMYKKVTLWKQIPGFTLHDNIIKHNSLNFLCCQMKIVLSVIDVAQKLIGYTHYDLHSQNIICKQEQASNVLYLHSFTSKPLLLDSCGYRPKLIDFEFNHVHTYNCENASCRLDLMEIGIDPMCFNQYYDAYRFMLSTFSAYGHLYPDLVTWKNELLLKNKSLCLNDQGLRKSLPDQLHNIVHMIAKSYNNPSLMTLLKYRYASLLSLLQYKQNACADVSYDELKLATRFIDLALLLLDCKVRNLNHLMWILNILVSSPNNLTQLFGTLNIVLESAWLRNIQNLINEIIPLMKAYTLHRRLHIHDSWKNASSIQHLISWLDTKYNFHYKINNSTVIHYMTQHLNKKILLNRWCEHDSIVTSNMTAHDTALYVMKHLTDNYIL